ncbi:endonuclease III, partial [Tremellales sp. Uapishka_1]
MAPTRRSISRLAASAIKHESALASKPVKGERSPPQSPQKSLQRSPDTKPDASLRDKKMRLHAKNAADGPFPTFNRPTPLECSLAHSILTSVHGPRIRPAQVVASLDRAGCGDSPSVLDALVRTILSQNTSDTNSSRAKRSMDNVYGRSDEWDGIVQGGQDKLQEAIKCGGLSAVKSRVILKILNQVHEKYGVYSLDHLHNASTEDAMAELLSFDGVGPKTASCVLLFCLQREDFAVDTHVHRITGLLGWRPAKANREQTYHHLNKRIPDEHKYGLHILLVTHGKSCDECKAGGGKAGKCDLRKAFRDQAKSGEDKGGVAENVGKIELKGTHGIKRDESEQGTDEVGDSIKREE